MADPSPLRIRETWRDDTVVLELAGDVGAGAAVDAFRARVSGLLEEGARKVIVNLELVRYLDSTGVGTLLALKTSAVRRHCHLRFCCLPAPVKRLLDQLHLGDILEVHEEEEQALKSMSQGTPPAPS
jgi:anti-sigma B factor antagonist